MNTAFYRGSRVATLLVSVALLAGCGLPRSGPSRGEVIAAARQGMAPSHVVDVDDKVVRLTSVSPALGFSQAFTTAGMVGSDTIRAGDILGLSVWENVDDGLLTSRGVNATELSQVQVDGEGYIFVPYAGRMRAAGQSPESLRAAITEKLAAQTPDPQVSVSRLAGDGSTVTVMGAIAGQGVYPIERPTRRLSSMIAKAGGVQIEPESAKITVSRGGQAGTVWLTDLYSTPRLDIALRPGDTIVVEADERSFTALGAMGRQNRVRFDTQNVSALEAIAQVGGLATNLADPRGVFVLRNESAAVANAVLGRRDLVGEQRMVYVLDLTEPAGLFMARDFLIRDEDTVYVTEAPFVTWHKTIAAITGSAVQIDSVTSLANGSASGN